MESPNLTDVTGIGPSSADLLAQQGIRTVEELAAATVEKLRGVPGFGVARASVVLKAAAQLLSDAGPAKPPTPTDGQVEDAKPKKKDSKSKKKDSKSKKKDSKSKKKDSKSKKKDAKPKKKDSKSKKKGSKSKKKDAKPKKAGKPGKNTKKKDSGKAKKK